MILDLGQSRQTTTNGSYGNHLKIGTGDSSTIYLPVKTSGLASWYEIKGKQNHCDAILGSLVHFIFTSQ